MSSWAAGQHPRRGARSRGRGVVRESKRARFVRRENRRCLLLLKTTARRMQAATLPAAMFPSRYQQSLPHGCPGAAFGLLSSTLLPIPMKATVARARGCRRWLSRGSCWNHPARIARSLPPATPSRALHHSGSIAWTLQASPGANEAILGRTSCVERPIVCVCGVCVCA